MNKSLTLGDIIQSAVTESAIKFLGLAGFDGIDDTDIETLTIFCCEVQKRTVELMETMDERGWAIAATFDVSDIPKPTDTRGTAITGGSDKEEAHSRHPSRALQEVPHQRWKARRAGAFSIIGGNGKVIPIDIARRGIGLAGE